MLRVYLSLFYGTLTLVFLFCNKGARGYLLFLYCRRDELITIERRKDMRGALFTLLLILCLVCTGVLIFASWQVNRDVNGWWIRAQVSSEPNDMLEYLQYARDGMERWGMTYGYANIIPIAQHPENDMGLIIDTIDNHVDQAGQLTEMDRMSPEYQTGLDNLRGSIRETNIHSWEHWSFHRGLVFWLGAIVGAIGATIAGCWWNAGRQYSY